MVEVPEIIIEQIAVARGDGRQLHELAEDAARGLLADVGSIGGVVAATFSNPERFPSLAVRVAASLGLPTATPAFDIQMACSAYPYAVYLAGRMAADTGKKILVIDGDVQSRLVNPSDRATGAIFSDAATACLVSSGNGQPSRFDFMSRLDDALLCPESGPIKMDGMRVFTFVATEVSSFLRGFGQDFDHFAPHQANPYMVRQLAKSLGLSDRLLTIPEGAKNPGSCSVPMAIAQSGASGRTLIAGFGAGFSAAAGIVTVMPHQPCTKTRGVFDVSSVEETWDVAKRLAAELKPGDVIRLEGGLGTGKTTFVQGLAAALGVSGRVTSPTFCIVQEHMSAGNAKLFVHMDLYRLESEADVVAIGWEDYVDRGAILAVEWPERAGSLIPQDAIRVSFSRLEDEDSRRIEIS